MPSQIRAPAPQQADVTVAQPSLTREEIRLVSTAPMRRLEAEEESGPWQSVVVKPHSKPVVDPPPPSDPIPELVPSQVTSGKVSVVTPAQFQAVKSSSIAQSSGTTFFHEQPRAALAASIPKPAPWVKEEDRTAPSLKQIQEAESKVAEARKAAERQAQVLQSQAHAHAEQLAAERAALAKEAESLPLSSTWGSGGDAKGGAGWVKPTGSGPHRTKSLMEIQQEEETRKKRIAAQQAQAAATANQLNPPQRAYASSAATAAQKVANASWTVVGAKTPPAKPTGPVPPTTNASAAPNQTPPNRVIPGIGPKLSTPVSTPALSGEQTPSPSPEFLKWCREALRGLTVNVDDFIQMLLDFPLEPASYHLEIISDSVYENSTTLDGRRFANDFVTKRKADALARIPKASSIAGNAANGKTVGTMADALKGVPRKNSQEWNVNANFKVVTPKQKKGKR
ncbi:hypothetical protein BT69DRAFT_691456 [Atractiella rhizophila]|nr:hypothetical protein BT69DRAFT_691456 [Atractiella rhizophila]